ncbi:MAG: DUF1295 domain-containing protein [Myxococcales bacterium]|nr:DUF1295 domain-containing protein [Myxococcales bacterium]
MTPTTSSSEALLHDPQANEAGALPGVAPMLSDVAPPEAAPHDAALDASPDLTRLGQHGWISGVVGAIVVLGMGCLASRNGAMTHGWGLGSSWGFFGSSNAPDLHLAPAFVLLVCAAVMFASELTIRLTVDRGRVVSRAEELRAGRLGAFLRRCVLVYLADLAVLSFVLWLYRIVNEYGFVAGHPYYQPWFSIIPYIWRIYAIGGLPYVVLTRAYQADPRSDRKQIAFTVMKVVRRLARRIGLTQEDVPAFDRYDRTAVLGLLVKAFFVPLMTVFFADQFGHLVNNWAYVLDTVVPHRGKPVAIVDVWNVSHSVIFSVDVGLAWAGYVLSSRWIKNTLFSVEPTLLGWTVALLCYPPFQNNLGYYFSTPNENAFLSLGGGFVVRWLAACSIASFFVYTAATVCFGLRFSNLTHRGIITTGPYAIIRHPAYTAKNFSWWCVMFPVALHQWAHGEVQAAYQIVGLVCMTGIYALRAITEERHLGKDPEYRKYAEKVRFRFIPGVL